MCTISVVPVVGGFSLTCNRDERLVRAAAVAPTSRRIGGVEAIFPTDTQAGGTWIAATDAGLAFALLNRCPERREPCEAGCAPPSTDIGAQTHTRATRGEIILALLTATHLGAVHRRVERLQVARYEPFQLIVVGGRCLLTATATGRALDISVRPIHAPVM